MSEFDPKTNETPYMQPAEPDYKAMYERLLELHEELQSANQKLILSQISPTRNWIAECAMAIMAELSIDVMRDSYVYTRSWERAEAWAAEGKKRWHI